MVEWWSGGVLGVQELQNKRGMRFARRKSQEESLNGEDFPTPAELRPTSAGTPRRHLAIVALRAADAAKQIES